MKFNADVRHQSVKPHDDDRINYVGVVADDAYAAARIVADAAAMRRYGEDDDDGDRVMGAAMTTHMEQIDETTFRAFIGAYDGGGRTIGTTVTIKLFDQAAYAEAGDGQEQR